VQLNLFGDDENHNRVTNVASVPQRSPFRYPGGKTWLIPQIRRWLTKSPYKPVELIEPFAGGAIVSLTAIAEGLVDHVTLIEMDDAVASVWQTIISDDGGAEWLSDAITTFDFNSQRVKDVLNQSPLTSRDQALQTIIRNRVNRGGIIAAGAGLLKEGENGKGLRSRWYPETLKKRILAIATYRDRMTFIHGDGLDVIQHYISRADMAFFMDPPYTASKNGAGKRLYTHSTIDHPGLFRLAAEISGDFLMSYENSDEVFRLANEYAFDNHVIAMKSTHHIKKSELLISRNLDWLRH
jgi:DNA adenine methylase